MEENSSNIIWLESGIIFSNFLSVICEKAGIIYIQGRDHSYRPIIVLNAYKVNFNEMSLE